MPIYEYMCAGCKKKFELLVRSPKAEPKRCPMCGNEDITKLFSSFGFSSGGSSVSSVGDSGCTSCSTNSCSTCR